MKLLKRDVHLVLSPHAAKVLDQVIGSCTEDELIHLKEADTKILHTIRKQIREFATEPK